MGSPVRSRNSTPLCSVRYVRIKASSASRTSESTAPGLWRRPDQKTGREDAAAVSCRAQIVGDADVAVRNGGVVHRRGPFVPPRLLEVLAIERAVTRHFALGAATDGTDFAADARDRTAGDAGLHKLRTPFF